MKGSRALQALGALGLMMRPDRRSERTIARILQEHAAHAEHGSRIMLQYENRSFTYDESNRHINRVANVYRSLGLRKGDVVALMMENRPEYLWHYFAAGKLGVVIALVNPNLRADGLLQAIAVVEPVMIIVGSEVWPRFAESRHRLAGAVRERVYLDVDPEVGGLANVRRIQELVGAASDRDPVSHDPPRLADLGAYIYTSGTTGMPKAANMSYYRLTNVSRAMAGLCWRMQPDDRIYCCLPLFHSNALLTAVGCTIAHGATLVLARRLSVRQFWVDAVRHGITGFNYIGEMCRYLLNAPVVPAERQHMVRTIVGQGLRKEIWPAFQARFGIKRIVEFYASTEGNVATLNLSGAVGSVGKLLFGGALVRWDSNRQEFVRQPDGRLVRSRIGEPGVLLGHIGKRMPFEGYRDEAASVSKIIRDAFEQGDAWYNTGDLFRMDWKRNLTFVDRAGDTYRYKGENVSTMQVEEQIGKWDAVAAVNVYGVSIDGIEGRVGAVSLVMRPSRAFDPAAFAEHVDITLPPAARPVFVRIEEALETTETLKLKKGRALSMFDPGSCGDRVYLRTGAMACFEQLTPTKYNEIVEGHLRL